MTNAEAVLNERGWFHRESERLRSRRLPKGDRERRALARIGRNMLGRWRAAIAAARAVSASEWLDRRRAMVGAGEVATIGGAR